MNTTTATIDIPAANIAAGDVIVLPNGAELPVARWDYVNLSGNKLGVAVWNFTGDVRWFWAGYNLTIIKGGCVDAVIATR